MQDAFLTRSPVYRLSAGETSYNDYHANHWTTWAAMATKTFP